MAQRPMSTRTLKRLAIVLPVLFWIVLLFIRFVIFSNPAMLGADLLSVLLVALGTFVFSFWVFNIIESREREIQSRNQQLEALRTAALALTTELDLKEVLENVVHLSRGLTGARYGALGVLDENGKYIAQFITSGITPEERARIGEPPHGHGLLGLIIKEGKSLRITSIASHPASVGFPANHPPMHTLLGVPLASKGKIIGDLYMTDKIETRDGEDDEVVPFTEEDQRILEMFAVQAAIAVENAQLYRQTQQLSILQERERFGMDLHDGIIQSIYATGLLLEDIKPRIASEPHEAERRITQSVHSLNDVMRDLRNYILGLRPERFQGRDLLTGLNELARELRANTFLQVEVETFGDYGALSPEQIMEILHIAQEALANIRKHARATAVNIHVSRDEQEFSLVVEDNGAGFDSVEVEKGKGHGLPNMRERARSLGGSLEIAPRPGSGTQITLTVPFQSS